MALPIVLAHVRLTTIGDDIEVLNPLKNAIHDLIKEYSDEYGFRIKRRAVPVAIVSDLLRQYAKTASTRGGGKSAASKNPGAVSSASRQHKQPW